LRQVLEEERGARERERERERERDFNIEEFKLMQ